MSSFEGAPRSLENWALRQHRTPSSRRSHCFFLFVHSKSCIRGFGYSPPLACAGPVSASVGSVVHCSVRAGARASACVHMCVRMRRLLLTLCPLVAAGRAQRHAERGRGKPAWAHAGVAPLAPRSAQGSEAAPPGSGGRETRWASVACGGDHSGHGGAAAGRTHTPFGLVTRGRGLRGALVAALIHMPWHQM